MSQYAVLWDNDVTIDRAHLARQFLPSLRQSERLPAHLWPAYQTRLLERFCRHAALQTDFYRSRLAPLFAGGDAAEGAFLHEHWGHVPILTRAEAQSQGEALYARETPPNAGDTVLTETSGSTGPAMKFQRSALADAAAMAVFERVLEGYDIDRTGALGWIMFDPKLDAGPRENLGWNLTHLAKRYELSKAASSREALDWLLQVRPRMLMAPPSIVDAMTREAQESGRRPEGLSAVLVTSETPAEDLRARVREFLGATLIDSYGTREVGQIAVDCPGNPDVKHINSEIMFVEIVDDDGLNVPEGHAGRVIVTPFYNDAMPLIRYDVGDIAAFAAPCPCGRTLPTLSGVLGRQNTLFRFRDGTRRRPTGLKALHGLLSAKQLQFVQTDLEAFEVRYAPDGSNGPCDRAAATLLLRERVHPDASVTFVAVDEIRRGPGGKYEEFVCRLA